MDCILRFVSQSTASKGYINAFAYHAFLFNCLGVEDEGRRQVIIQAYPPESEALRELQGKVEAAFSSRPKNGRFPERGIDAVKAKYNFNVEGNATNSLAEIGRAWNQSRENIRRLCVVTEAKLRRTPEMTEIRTSLFGPPSLFEGMEISALINFWGRERES